MHAPVPVAVNMLPAIEQLPGFAVTANEVAPVPDPPVVLSVVLPR